MWDLVGNPEDQFSHNEAHNVMQTTKAEQFPVCCFDCKVCLIISRLFFNLLQDTFSHYEFVCLFSCLKPKVNS